MTEWSGLGKIELSSPLPCVTYAAWFSGPFSSCAGSVGGWTPADAGGGGNSGGVEPSWGPFGCAA